MLCNFHWGQAWEPWLNAVANCMQPHKGMILACLRRIANSKKEVAYNRNIKDLIQSDILNMDQAQKLRD